jgi:hypothetical protein
MAAEFFDSRILRALEAVEWCADDPQAEAVTNAVWNQLVTSPNAQLPQGGRGGGLARVITDVFQLLDEWWDGIEYKNARHAIAHAVFLSLRDQPRRIFTGGSGDAAEYCAQAIDHAAMLLLGGTPEGFELDGPETEGEVPRAIANIIRDIFGNPFRPVVLDPDWWTPNVVANAHTIHEERRFSELAVLADALEEAGCINEDILNHCRLPSEHVRGCWVLSVFQRGNRA